MEMRLLRYFWTIAEEGTISKAADVLHITQPTLSRQLKALEDELGTTLFVRSKKQMVLTEAGLFLKTRAADILELTQQTVQEFEARKKQLFSGRISIGCVEADGSSTLAQILETFVHDYPQVTFNIYSGISDDIQDRLEKGLVDVGILLEPVATEKYHTLLLPQTERWGVLVAQDTPLAQQTQITPEALLSLPLIIPARAKVQRMLAHWGQVSVADLNVVGTFDFTFNVQPLVARHVGVAVGIEGVSKQTSAQTKFLPLAPEIQTHCVLVWKRNRALSPVVKTFIDYFNHALKA